MRIVLLGVLFILLIVIFVVYVVYLLYIDSFLLIDVIFLMIDVADVVLMLIGDISIMLEALVGRVPGPARTAGLHSL
jgi:hypothetical protein